MSLKSWLFQRALTKQIRLHRSKDPSKSPIIGNEIAILHNVEEGAAIENFKNQLEKIGKKVDIFSFKNDSSEIEDSKVFNQKDCNWYQFPNSPKILQFIDQSPDILIVLNMENQKIMTSLGAMSQASFKIGINDDNINYYNLIVDSKNSSEIATILADIKEALKKLTI